MSTKKNVKDAAAAEQEKANKPAPGGSKPAPGDTPQAPPADTPQAPPVAPQKKRRYLVNARYDHPPFGGIPMPAGRVFYGFATVKVTESKSGAGINEKQALAAVKKNIKEEVANLVIESVSVLPENW
jgi:hypothetical protein